MCMDKSFSSLYLISAFLLLLYKITPQILWHLRLVEGNNIQTNIPEPKWLIYGTSQAFSSSCQLKSGLTPIPCSVFLSFSFKKSSSSVWWQLLVTVVVWGFPNNTWGRKKSGPELQPVLSLLGFAWCQEVTVPPEVACLSYCLRGFS